ncbi:hypothetical protein B0H14DRAFT_3589842 [Mycena olivaceomarginata]|nr:hypothetical protein B0H14DRAFT_3589842 [Mycena olivaceomarginata]
MCNPAERMYYYVLAEDGSGIGSEVLLFPHATDLLEVLRQQWGPDIKGIIKHLLARGIPFWLAYRSLQIMPEPTPAPAGLQPKGFKADTNSGLVFRPHGHKFDQHDYRVYTTRRDFQLLHTPWGRIALQYGGVVARLASSEVSDDDFFRRFDNEIYHDQEYIAEGDFQPGGSPDNEFRIQLDPHDDDPTFHNVLGSPPFPHTPSYNGSYHNSPYSNHSELSFSADPTQDSFALFDDEPGQQQARDGYDPAEYDAPQAGGGLLMFNDSDYMSGPGPYVSSVPVGPAPDRHRGSYNYSSPNSSGGEEQQAHQQQYQSQNRASLIASNHHQEPQSSPRMNVAQAFDNVTFRSPNWGTEPLHLPCSPRAASPHMQQQQKPLSPPCLLMPDDNSGPSNFDPPTINAPEGDGLGAGPRLRIVPATPVSGGGAAGGAGRAGVPGDVASGSDRMLTPVFFCLVTEQQDEYRAEQQQSNTYDPAPAQPGGHRRTGSNVSVNSNSNSPFLFPSNMLPGPGPRSASDHALEPPNNFIGQMGNIGSALDDSMGDVILPSQGQHRRYDSGGGSLSPSPHLSSFGGAGGAGYAQAPGSAGLDNGFLSSDLGMGFGLGGGGGGEFGGGLGLGLGTGGGGAVGLRKVGLGGAGARAAEPERGYPRHGQLGGDDVPQRGFHAQRRFDFLQDLAEVTHNSAVTHSFFALPGAMG